MVDKKTAVIAVLIYIFDIFEVSRIGARNRLIYFNCLAAYYNKK